MFFSWCITGAQRGKPDSASTFQVSYADIPLAKQVTWPTLNSRHSKEVHAIHHKVMWRVWMCLSISTVWRIGISNSIWLVITDRASIQSISVQFKSKKVLFSITYHLQREERFQGVEQHTKTCEKQSEEHSVWSKESNESSLARMQSPESSKENA